MAHSQGFSFGENLVSALLFFFPRALWESKMSNSGEILGEFLTNTYGMWFTNISCPLIGELYWAGGVPAVIIGAVFLGYLFSKIERLKVYPQYAALYLYVSFSLFFIMRGALMPAVAFTAGGSVAFYLVSLLHQRRLPSSISMH